MALCVKSHRSILPVLNEVIKHEMIHSVGYYKMKEQVLIENVYEY